MSNYPNGFDDDSTLPVVNDNLTEIGGDAINALRDAVFQIEQALGTNIAGITPSLAARLGVFINPDGKPNVSVLTSLGLVTLPIRNDQIAEAAGIPESKLHLDFRTQDLFNYIRDLSLDINATLGWINTEGIKLEPHLIGAIYRHTMDQIDVSNNTNQFLKNNLRVLRNNTNSYTLVNDMNSELLAHQWADGSPFGPLNTITTNNGSTYTSYFAHVGSGIFINPTRFNNIPQTLNNLQLFAEFIDSSSIFLLGTRIQNLYTNGISRVSESSSLTVDGYGQFIVPPTPAIAYLLNIGNNSSPFDDINSGDDIVVFNPSTASQLNNYFDSLFALVKPGDIIRVHYGDGYNIEVPYVIKEKKYNSTVGNKKYQVRIAGKNQAYSPNAIARIDRPLANNNKYGELSISPVNNAFNATPSLIINNPRGAQATGVGFDPDQFDETHYLLYLAFYPTGHAVDGYTFLPGIDVTGNQGKTPGLYTLESVVQATNNAFHAVGFNYRFTAFASNGEFGICLADSYHNSAFSIVSTVIAPDGSINTLDNSLHFPNNVISVIPVVGTVAPDPLGFGPTGSGVASPPFMTSYGSSAAALNPTKLFIPLRRNNYYVNGSETERLAIEDSQALDGYGDGYWVATLQNVQVQVGRVQTTYRIPLNLNTSRLKVGKTVVIQSLGSGSLVDFGRYIIQSVNFNCAPNVYTDITVYDSVHAKGFSPSPTLQSFAPVAVYFCSDSVSFNVESSTDFAVTTPFKRNFEVYVDQFGKTFTHERGRFTLSGTDITVNGTTLYGYVQLNKLDIVAISPKLRGYQFGSVNKITLNMFSYSSTTGLFDGYLASYDGVNLTHFGPRTQGKRGEIIRFYDETNTDYIDVILDSSVVPTSFTNQRIDFQLFPTLQLDTELMLIGTCQVNDTTQTVSKIVDKRQFGNISEKDLSDSVFNFMSIPEKLLHSNGVVRGFDIFNVYTGAEGLINLSGGVILVDGQLIDVNNDSINIPTIQESYNFNFWNVNWAVVIDSNGDYDAVPLLDPDSVLITPGVARTFTAFDPVSSNSYNMPAVYFFDLINKRTDLTVLYIVSSIVTGSGSGTTIALTVKDARKFVYKKDWGERPTLCQDSNNGEFRTFDALTSWFNLHSNYTSTVNVKGLFTSFPAGGVTFLNPARFLGDGTATFSPTNGQLSFFAVSLDNITLNVQTLDWNSAPMNGCTINFNPTGGGHFNTFNTLITNTTINYTGSGGPCNFLANTRLENVTINLNGANESIDFSGTIAKDCTINVNASGCSITVDFNGTVENCTFNLNSTSTTWSMLGTMINCTVNWNAIGTVLPITAGSAAPNTFNFLGNRFITVGMVSAPSSMISVVNGSNGLISNNMFFRSGIVLTNGYILAPATGEVDVIGNFFDSSTYNGTDQNLVKSMPLSWRYNSNLNTPATQPTNTTATGNGIIPYTVALDDDIILLTPQAAMTVNLPQISLSPPGRRITIKDVTGVFDTNPVTLHRAVNTETIEGLAVDYVYKNPFGSITLVAGTNGWVII